MNAIYFSMKGTSQKVTLPTELDMESIGCLLFDISSTVKPYIEQPIYLYADFVGNSIIVGSEHLTKSGMQLPILHQINLRNSHDEDNVVEIDPNYNKILWLPSSSSPVEKIQVYLSDRHRNPPQFMHCNIIGTLVCIPHTKSSSVEKWKNTLNTGTLYISQRGDVHCQPNGMWTGS